MTFWKTATDRTINLGSFHVSVDYRKTLRGSEDGTDMDLMVTTRSDRTGIEGVEPWRSRVRIRVHAPPLDGKANKEIEAYLSKLFAAPVCITHGQSTRMKTAHIDLNPDEVLKKLEELE